MAVIQEVSRRLSYFEETQTMRSNENIVRDHVVVSSSRGHRDIPSDRP